MSNKGKSQGYVYLGGESGLCLIRGRVGAMSNKGESQGYV
jgi:hypothetical protein